LEPEPYELLRSFTAVVTEEEGEFQASLFDLSVFASGDTEEEAIANLKETLLDTVDRLNELPDARLGKGLLRQKNLLNKIVRKTQATPPVSIDPYKKPRRVREFRDVE
jgi:predicted RNase H-like HicB family nuclease